MYSTPKYKANVVNNKTRLDATMAKVSAQKTKWESIKSKQKNHLPKSIKK
jgi:flagellar basal body rod protein FlgB